MKIRTGQTVYESVLSYNNANAPVTGVTFDTKLFNNGITQTGITISEVLADEGRGLYTFSWSASTYGDYQLYVKNIDTNVLYISNVYKVVSNNEADMTVYVGL